MQQALLEILAKHTSLAAAASDADGTLTLMTPALERILGHTYCPWPEGDLPDVLHLFHEDGQTPLEPEEMPIAKARRGHTVIDEVVAARPEDSTDGMVFLRCNAEPLRDEGGSIRGAFALVMDITEEWRARARQAELRDRLIMTVNHELRTPLTKILGHAELLQDGREDLPAWARPSLDAMNRAANDLAYLSTTITQLVDLEAMSHADRTSTDVTDCLRAAADHVRAATDDVRSPLVLQTPSRLRAHVDPEALTRAVSELLENALTYSPADREVVLRAEIDGSLLVIVVGDQGPGIPREDRERLLEPFERGNRPGQPVNTRGLGLAYARTIANAHGGTLTLESNAPQGTIATLRLRRHPRNGPADPTPGVLPQRGLGH
jgi:signal transduction histidine kinase